MKEIIMFSINKHKLLYAKYLRQIGGITFTSRECDIISCVVNNRGDKKIATICSVAHKTVSSHIYNIMQKLRCNSREQIIDFIQKVGVLKIFREYYNHLLVRHYFDVTLKKISKTLKAPTFYVFIDDLKIEESLYKHILNDLKVSGITLKELYQKDAPTFGNNIIDLHSITVNNYYEDFLCVIMLHINTEPVLAIGSDFTNYLKSIRENFEGVVDFKDSKPNSKESFILLHYFATFYNNKIILFLAIFIIIVSFSLLINFDGFFNKNSINEITKDLEGFVEISKENKFTANNLNKESVAKNHDIIKKIEYLSSYRNLKSVQKYFDKAEMSYDFILSYIHGLQALACYYMYNEHDGFKAEEILLHAKYIAENYISKRNKSYIEFEKQTPEEIFSEMQIIKHLPEMYTRVLFSLGRTSIYTMDFVKGKKYFEISKYLGLKLHLFEGYLSDVAGILAIEMRETENITISELKLIKLKDLISKFEKLQDDNQEYILDYNSHIEIQQTIIPSSDKLNMLCCQSHILNLYRKLILIEDSSFFPQIEENLCHIFNTVKDTLENTVPRKRAAFYNLIADNILSLFNRGYRDTKISREIASAFHLKADNDLDIAYELYNFAKLSSRETDYTKADAYDGAINVMRKKLEMAEFYHINNKEQLLNKIEEYLSKRDAINHNLARKIVHTPFLNPQK